MEFLTLNENNIYDLEVKVNIFPITNGARGAILRKMKEDIHSRKEKLTQYIDVNIFENFL